MNPIRRDAVLVFARHCDRGPVKTRLAAAVGAERAQAIYRALAEAVWQGLADPDFERWLLVEPPDAVQEAERWLPGAARVLGQAPGDLGERLLHGIEAAFAAGAPRVAVVGTDAPQVDAALVKRAFSALDEAGAAIVPAHDGGYALLALRAPCPALFDAIPWSTTGVLEATRARAAVLGMKVVEFPPVRDLDTIEDLRALEQAGAWRAGRQNRSSDTDKHRDRESERRHPDP